jgi:hypothetical protein
MSPTYQPLVPDNEVLYEGTPLLFEQGGVKLTLVCDRMGTPTGNEGFTLHLIAENDSTSDKGIRLQHASINGVMISPLAYLSIPAGEFVEEKDYVELRTNERDFNFLDAAGYGSVNSIDLQFSVEGKTDSGTFGELYSKIIRINFVSDGVWDLHDDGSYVFDENGVRLKVFMRNNSYLIPDGEDGYSLLLAVENMTEDLLYTQLFPDSVNRKFVDGRTLYADTFPGQRSYLLMTFTKSQLKEIGVSDINHIAFYIKSSKVYNSSNTLVGPQLIGVSWGSAE